MIKMIYILDKNKNPLMPTERHGKIRKLLNEGKAKVVKQIPFTIQLLYDSTEFTQPVTLGVDSGNIHVGLSAVANNKELYSGEHVLRTGKNSVHELLESRKTLRRSRRNRKTRYRKPRFENRARKPVDGFDKWYTPTTRCQIKGHIHAIDNITKIIPITDIIVECGAFPLPTSLWNAVRLIHNCYKIRIYQVFNINKGKCQTGMQISENTSYTEITIHVNGVRRIHSKIKSY